MKSLERVNEGVLSGRLLNELMKEAAAKRERKQTKRLNDQQAHPTMIRVNERTLHGPAQR